MTAVAPARQRLLAPASFRSTYLHAVHAEIGKAAQSRGFWITSAIAIAITAGITALIAKFSKATVYDPMVGGLWNFLSLFIVPLAVLMVTNEYTHNTMRTTVLATPRRLTAFAAKLTAVFVFCGILVLLMQVADFLVAHAVADLGGIVEHGGRSIAITWVVLTTLALGAAGLAYLLRSTAGSIVSIIAVLNFASLLSLIPNETVQKYILPYLPNAVGNSAVATTTVDGLLSAGPSWPTAAVLWILYMVALVCAGMYRFTRTDI